MKISPPLISSYLIHSHSLHHTHILQDPIAKPMLLTHDKRVRKEAVDLFRLVQMFMGDRPAPRGKESNQLALEVVTKCWDPSNGVTLRDEIYIQLCKQTFLNRQT